MKLKKYVQKKPENVSMGKIWIGSFIHGIRTGLIIMKVFVK